MDSVKYFSSVAETLGVVLLVLVVIFELVALLWKARERLFAVLSLSALLLLAGAEYIANQYNHRKDALYETREQSLTVTFDQKLQRAGESAQKAQNRASAAEAQAEELKRQHAPRTLTPQQKASLVTMLKILSPQELYFVCSPDPESQQYFAQLANAFTSAGWKFVFHPSNWGTVVLYPAGLQVWVSDTRSPPRGALVLQEAFKKIGVKLRMTQFLMVGEGKFTLYVGPKPSN